jgi:quinoprotein glucose dehydrogenase
VNDVIVVGSWIFDNLREAAPSGRVLAFDARSGQPAWEFDPLPRDPADPASATWVNGSARETGGANVWSVMAVDQDLDMVYLPTTSPSIDIYGASRPGAGAHANSVVALNGKTGKVVWAQQLVHHDLWDYDLPAQPVLADIPRDGRMIPALVQNTKMGIIFVFDRRTGAPLFPLEERPVPQTGAAPGEWLSPTQPFPVGIVALSSLGIQPDDAWGFTPIDKWWCRKRISELNYGPIYTPPSTKGTIEHPSIGGGANWGGGGYDPQSHLMIVATNHVGTVITLVAPDDNKAGSTTALDLKATRLSPGVDVPYRRKSEPLLSPLGAPCTAPPWATLTAVDMVTGQKRWEIPLGSIAKLAPVPIPWEAGAPGAGGPLITAGGLVFIGYAADSKFRAVDLATGKTLWKVSVPASATAVPVTYEVDGVQYVVVAAGGHGIYDKKNADAVIAYKLKR